eukprot:UN24598
MSKPKNSNDIFNKVYIHLKIFGARTLVCAVHARSHIVLKIQKSPKCVLEHRILCMRASGSARAPEFFH